MTCVPSMRGTTRELSSVHNPPMRRFVAGAAFAAALVLVTAAGAAKPVKEINVWAGQWLVDPATKGGFALRALSVERGFAAFAELKAERCDPPTTYYRGGYYYPASGARGKIVGCTDGAWHLVGRYVGDPQFDPKSKGVVDIEFKPP